jgi:hypothetical protein
VDWTLHRSVVDQRWWQTRSSLEEGRAGIPVRRTSSWWRGEQEEGMGIPTLGGTRLRRGSDGRASVEGGSGAASSTRKFSGRGGEGRTRAASTVWRGGGRGAFYRFREEGRRLGKGGRWPVAIVLGRGFYASVMILEGVVREGKWRRREAAQLHTLKRVARGHDTAVARPGRW